VKKRGTRRVGSSLWIILETNTKEEESREYTRESEGGEVICTVRESRDANREEEMSATSVKKHCKDLEGGRKHRDDMLTVGGQVDCSKEKISERKPF